MANSKKNNCKRTTKDDRREMNSNNRKMRYSKSDSKNRDRRAKSDPAYKMYDESRTENDVSWYSKYPELLQAAASFPFPYRPGMSLPPVSNVDPKVTFQLTQQIPGVMVLDWVPTIGRSNTVTDPASVAAKEIYAKVRAAFSGQLVADAPDFITYLMALDSIFAYIAACKRVYRLINAFSPNNYFLPDRVLQAMGFSTGDIQDLRQNKSLLWQHINELVLQSRKFTCPAVMDIFNRHYWMSDNVYTDAATINSQLYVFNLAGTLIYGVHAATVESERIPGLIFTKTPWMHIGASAKPMTEALFSYGLDMIQALVNWDDAYTINGYLQRAFEGSPTFIVDEIEADQPFTPVYEEEVLVQIENSRALPCGYLFRQNTGLQNVFFNVYQEPKTNAVKCDLTYETLQPYTAWSIRFARNYNLPPRITLRSDAPTPALTTIATRLKANTVISSTGTGESQVFHYDIDCGTEIPLAWYCIASDKDLQATNTRSVEPFLVVTDMTGALASIPILMAESNFDWHPISDVIIASTANPTEWVSDSTAKYTLCGDLHNTTQITPFDLENLHRVCVYSELNAFSIG